MRITEDVHTHTFYSHGKNSIEEMTAAAVKKGLSAVHITEHGKAHWTARKMNMQRYEEMKNEIVRLRLLYPQIKIIFGLEANIISTDGDLDFTDEELALFDTVNAGFHMMAKMKNLKSYIKITLASVIFSKLKIRLFQKSFCRTCTESMICALHRYNINMITHPTSRFLIDLIRVAEACEETSTLLEINSSRSKLDASELASLKDRTVLFAAGSDAHSADRAGDFTAAEAVITESGIDLSRIVNIENK